MSSHTPDTTEIEEVEVEFGSGSEVEEEELVDEEDVPSPSPSSAKLEAAPKKTTPGKVKASKEVSEMYMKSPSTPGSALKPNKNPFPAYGNWTEADIANIKIDFPILSSRNESTNELTRKTRPEARYWKAPISFKYGSYGSTTMRFNNVNVPFHAGASYGTGFMYLCLPKYVENAFAVAGKTRAPTKTTENSLMPDSNRWWKIVNKIEGKVGVVDAKTKTFMPKSLATIFSATQMGVKLSVVLSFVCKAATEETEAITNTTVRTIAVELVRGWIDETDLNVEGPIRNVSKKAEAPAPTATKADLASESLMKRLADLGL